MNILSIKNAWTYRLLMITTLALSLCLLNACEDESGTNNTSCSVTISDFELSTKTFAAGDEITGSVVIRDNVGLDDFVLRDIAKIYLSEDDVFSSNDTEITAFSSAPTSSGNETTVTMDIQFPFSLGNSGSKYLLAHISSRPCGDGTTIPTDTYAVAVTVE